jgi:hypothetical protein
MFEYGAATTAGDLCGQSPQVVVERTWWIAV